MYSVSEAYIEQMMNRGTRRRLTGKVGDVPFTGEDVVLDSFGITGKAAEESDTKIGGVFLGELELTFVPSFLNKVAREEFFGKEVEISIGLWVPDPEDEINGGDWVDVPVGVYTLQAPKISKQGISVNGYDHMKKLDKPFNIDTTTGLPWNYLNYIATECNVEIGNTQEEIEALPNGTETLGLYSDNDIETFRDILYWLAQTLGCFACADREGRIVLRKLGKSNNVDFDESHRDADVVFSGYTTKWTGVSFVDTATQTTMYYGLPIDDGLTMNMGENPFLQIGSADAIDRRRTAVLNAVAQIQYVPFYVNSARDPIFDLGDEINFTGGMSGNSTGCIMAYTFSFDNFTFEGYGDDPALATAKNKSDKNISNLKRSTTENEVTYYNFANLQAVSFSDGEEKTIANLAFTSAQVTTVKILHEFIFDFLLDLSQNSSYELKYYLDEQLVPYSPYESLNALNISTEIEGEPVAANIDPVDVSITRDFFYILKEVQPDIRHTWRVTITAHNCEGSIGINHAHVSLEGQRLFSSEAFDGFIEARDEFPLFALGELGVLELEDTPEIIFTAAAVAQATDNFNFFSLGELGILGISDSMQIFTEGGFYIATEDGKIITTEDGRGIITE